jgi:hypothetical protein
MSQDTMLPTAFLVFANNVTPAQRSTYESWHGAHHVPQRLTVHGITGATRYQALGIGSPEYLTLYHLSTLSVLDSAAYRALVDEPDSRTLAMRPHIRAPLRFACRTIAGRNTIVHPTNESGAFLAAGLLRKTVPVGLKRRLSGFLEGQGLPYLIGSTHKNAGGHPVFQQHEDADVYCVLVMGEQASILDPIRAALSERWDFALLPAMQRIADPKA